MKAHRYFPRTHSIAVLFLTLFFTLLAGVSAQDNWFGSFHTGAFGVKALDQVSANTAFGVGQSGLIIRTLDGGNSWEALPSGVAVDISGLSFVDDQNGWVVGANVTGQGPVILHTSDGGDTWERQSAPGGFNRALLGVYFLDSQRGWAVGDFGQVAVTSNGGNSWTSVTSGTTSRLNSVHFTDASNGIIVGGSNTQGIVLRSSNGGNGWSAPVQVSALELYSVRFVSGQSAVAVGNNGTIIQTPDAGSTWAARTAPIGAFRPLRALAASGSTVYAAGDTVVVLSTDGGVNWVRRNTGLRGNQVFPAQVLNGVAVSSSNAVWVAGEGGSLLHSTNQGQQWTSQLQAFTDPGFSVDVNAVCFIDNQTGWAVGANATGVGPLIMRTDDGGRSWTRQSAPGGFNRALLGVYFLDSQRGWAVGDFGQIAITSNGGNSWTSVTSGTTSRLNSVHFTDASNGIIVGGSNTQGIVLRSSNGGNGWSAPVQVSALELYSVRFVSGQSAVAVGNNGTIIQTPDAGSSWAARTAPIGAFRPLRSISVTGNTVFAAGDTVVVLSTDGGVNWVRRNTGLRGNQVFPAEVVNAIAMGNATHGWIGGDGGIIFKTENGGQSWTRQNSPFAGASIKAMDYNTQRVAFVGTLGTSGYNASPLLTGLDDPISTTVSGFRLEQNYPNPFNPTTQIAFVLPRAGQVNLTVYDVLGRAVATLVDEAVAAGEYRVTFDGRDLSSGIYFYQLRAGDFMETRRMMLVK